MAGTPQLKAWFFAITSVLRADGTQGGVRFRKSDKPTQQTFENLLSSTTFKTESGDRARINTGATLASEQGLTVLANDTQAKSNATQLTDRSLVVQPHQLPTAEAIANSTVEDMPTTPLAISTITNTTRNQYSFRLNTTWVTWLISRIIPQGGTTGQVLVKDTNANYDTSWQQLGDNTTFINALTSNSTFTTQLATTINNIITNNPTFISEGLPVGFMQVYPITTMPSAKWLRCDGSAISRTTYSSLFSILGTTYGIGDGSTTFNLPDLRDRQVTGYSGSKALSTTGGADSHTLTTSNLPAHTHGVGSLTIGLGGNHVHGVPAIDETELGASSGFSYYTGGKLLSGTGFYSTSVATPDAEHTHSISGNTNDGGFGATPLDTKDAYLAMNFIIKVTL